MTKKKTTKHALISSLISLALCFAMLVGTTFAWYTDSITSGRNNIVAGSLNLSLTYRKVVNDVETWAEVTDQTPIFPDDLSFEPGAVHVAYVKVANTGDLAFKYSLAAVVDSETKGTNQAGDYFYLSDYLKFKAVATDTVYTTRADAVAALGTNPPSLAGGASLADAAVLKAGDPEVMLALIIYMPEDVGNVANPLPGDANKPKITFGLDAVATQYTIEKDSFDDQYDAAAVMPEIVSDFSSMKEVLANVSTTEPVTIQLTDNIIVPDDAEKSYISIPANTDVTLDLNGKTISGGRTDQKPNYGMINVGKDATLTIENGTVTYGDPGDGSWSAYRNTISIQRGTLIIKNATIENTCQAGISSAIDIMSNTGAEDAKLIIEDSTITSTRYGVRLFGNSTTGKAILEMKNCTVDAASSGIFLHQPQGSNKKGLIEATLTDSTIKGRAAVYVWDCNSVAGDNGDNIKLTLNGTTTLTSTDTYVDKDAAIAAHDDGAFPGYNGQIAVDYSTAGGDTNFKVTDNR